MCKGSGRIGECYPCKGNGYTIGYESSVSVDTVAEENTFFGTIDGEEVVGYLDDTYQYRIDGETDYNGGFVIYDQEGRALHQLWIRIDEGNSVKTYTSASKGGALSVSYYPALSEDFKWGSRYDTAASDDWSITLDEVNCSSDGVFSGTINAVLKPAKYGGKGLEGEVQISGVFHMQMQEVHLVAEEYRKENSKYDAANPHNYYQSYSDDTSSGDISSSDSSTSSTSSGSSFKVDHTCRTCHGDRKCTGCAGRGWKVNKNNGKIYDCVRCRGTGQCDVCHGTGKIY